MPKVDTLGLEILFLLIPGIIALGVVKSIGPKRPRSDFESGLQIFIYGVACYLLVGFLEGLLLWHRMVAVKPPNGRTFWQVIGHSSLGLATLKPEAGMDSGQIVFATCIAVVLGCVVANVQRYSLAHRLLAYLKLSSRLNDVDIWTFVLNSPDVGMWVTVRHHDNGKVYQGWVRAFSDGGDEREILLGDVTVYAALPETNDMVKVDSVPILYLGLDRKSIVLEMPEKASPLSTS
jgi:Family of unknown function (DUF6338)